MIPISFIKMKMGNLLKNTQAEKYLSLQMKKAESRIMNQNSPSPTMYVFAGNNGSGKSTIRNLLIDKLGIEINIDADSIARRLNPKAFRSKLPLAGKTLFDK